MGVLDTTYTFTATDVVTSAKLNNVIDQTTFTSSAVATNNTTLAVTASGQLKVNTSGITSNELADNSVTATKLNGAQSGSAPIFGARAYGSFNGQATSPITPTKAGNIASITRYQTGGFTVVMTTAMENSNYCVVASSNHQGNVSFGVSSNIQIINNTSFNIIAGSIFGTTNQNYNPDGVNFVVFQ